MSLRDELNAVAERNGGVLTPAGVVDAARPTDHPLHDRFEWDDTLAGEAWRRQQAREMIRSVRVVYKPPAARGEDPVRTVRAFHAIRTEEGNVYQDVDEVVRDPLTRQLVLMEMEREWRQLYAKYQEFTEFLELVAADLQATA